MAKTVENASFDLEMRRLNGDKNVDAAKASDLTEKAVNNVSASVWNKGDIIDCEAIDDTHVKIQKFGTGENKTKTPLLLVNVTNEGKLIAKRLYFSTLTRSIPEYRQIDGGVEATGKVISAADYAEGSAFFNEMMECANAAEQLGKLKGHKTLTVVDVIEVETARYQNGVQLNRTRKAKLPIFAAK